MEAKQGAKLLRHLSGPAKAVVDDFSVAEITSEQGVDKIVAALKVYFQPHLETAVPRALERAVYAGSREQKESLRLCDPHGGGLSRARLRGHQA